MGSYSRSSSDGRYRKGTHGSGYYQKKGLLGNLMNIIGSGSGSWSRRKRQGNYHDQPAPGQQAANENRNPTTCSKCRAKIPAGSKFCLQCGEKVTDVLFCPNCGGKLPPDARFCSQCGTKVNG